jgi:Domain of unknown function (DUF397)
VFSETGSHSLEWRKAQRSMGNGECVEVAPADSKILVRDSKNPTGVTLGYPTISWRFFLSSAKQGNFDGLKLL